MVKRKAISKKTRFETFNRDHFTCQYCGSKTPNVVLEVDHIIPVSKNGTNEIDNLVTSCFECNRGKSNNLLENIPKSLQDKSSEIKEKELQYKEYVKIQRQKERRISNELAEISDVYSKYFPEWSLNHKFKHNTIKMFISKLDFFTVKESMEYACGKINDSDDSLKYFCGVCWNKIKGDQL